MTSPFGSHTSRISITPDYGDKGYGGFSNRNLDEGVAMIRTPVESATGMFNVLVVRNELKMGKGKIPAECSHRVGNQQANKIPSGNEKVTTRGQGLSKKQPKADYTPDQNE